MKVSNKGRHSKLLLQQASEIFSLTTCRHSSPPSLFARLYKALEWPLSLDQCLLDQHGPRQYHLKRVLSGFQANWRNPGCKTSISKAAKLWGCDPVVVYLHSSHWAAKNDRSNISPTSPLSWDCWRRPWSLKDSWMVPKKIGSANTHTVDGGNPAPVDRYFIPFKVYRVLYIQVVRDFFHQQYFLILRH